jgi:hypothetical protein
MTTPFTSSQLVWSVLLAIWTTILLISSIFLYMHRHSPSIVPRFPLITLIGILSHWIIVFEISLAKILPDTIPCYVTMWTVYLFVNLWLDHWQQEALFSD